MHLRMPLIVCNLTTLGSADRNKSGWQFGDKHRKLGHMRFQSRPSTSAKYAPVQAFNNFWDFRAPVCGNLSVQQSQLNTAHVA